MRLLPDTKRRRRRRSASARTRASVPRGSSARRRGRADGGPVAPTADFVSRRGRRGGSGGGRGGGPIFPRGRRPATPVRRAWLMILLAASLALMTTSYRQPAAIEPFESAVAEVVAPIELGLTRAWQPVEDAVDWIGRLFSAMGDAPRLERENGELRAKLAMAAADHDELQRLRAAANLDERNNFPDGYSQMLATVTYRSSASIDRTLRIDAGSRDGVREGDPVLTVEGNLVGRVDSVTSNTAAVLLVLHPEVTVTATVPGTDAVGSLRSTSNEGSPVMALADVPQSAKVDEGDYVVTAGFTSDSGLRSLFPFGIPLGFVSDTGNKAGDLYKTVQVTPFADFDRIDEVFVLMQSGDEGRAFDSSVLESGDEGADEERPSVPTAISGGGAGRSITRTGPAAAAAVPDLPDAGDEAAGGAG